MNDWALVLHHPDDRGPAQKRATDPAKDVGERGHQNGDLNVADEALKVL